MANEVEKFNTIAIGDIEKINTIASGDIEDLNTLEFTSVLPISVSHTANAVSTTDATAYTFSSQAIGDADATTGSTRRVVVGTGMLQDAAGTPSVASVVIGGVSATQIISVFVVGPVALWSALVPSGTTASIVVTFSARATGCGIGVWSALNTNGVLASGSDTNANSSALSVTLNSAANGAIVGYGFDFATSTFAWGELTENFDQTVEANRVHTGASKTYTSAASRTVTCDPTGSSNSGLVVASFN